MSVEKLLPCWHCGGEPKVMQADHPSYTPHGEGWYVICKCGATLGYHGTDELYMTYGDFASEFSAIEAWNTRAPVEHDGWFYLPKPKESIVQYGEQRTEKIEHGYKVTQSVEVIEGAICSWGDELGEYVMKRICEAWNTRTHGTLTAEQVEDIVYRHTEFYEGGDVDVQAITDELNAKRGSGTCCLHYGEDDDGYDGWYCDECGGWFQAVWRDGHLVEPKHCQECGRQVER